MPMFARFCPAPFHLQALRQNRFDAKNASRPRLLFDTGAAPPPGNLMEGKASPVAEWRPPRAFSNFPAPALASANFGATPNREMRFDCYEFGSARFVAPGSNPATLPAGLPRLPYRLPPSSRCVAGCGFVPTAAAAGFQSREIVRRCRWRTRLADRTIAHPKA